MEIVDRIEAGLLLVGVLEEVLEAVGRRFRYEFSFFGFLLFLSNLDERLLLLGRHQLAILEVEQSSDVDLLLSSNQLDRALSVLGTSAA